MPLLNLPEETILVLVTALGVAVVTLWHQVRAMTGRVPARRPLAALEVIRSALGRGAETGRAIHLSPGPGTIGNPATTGETIAGLLAIERVATEAALNGAPVLVSSGDAVSHLALRGVVRQAYQRAGQSQDFSPARIQLLAHQDPTAYAAGATTLYARERLEASQLLGSFGQEFLLIGEDGAQRDVPQLAGATSTVALPLMLLSSRGTLIGEEIFAAESYLSQSAAPQARLMTHDLLRTVLIAALVLFFAYNLLQPSLGLPALPGL